MGELSLIRNVDFAAVRSQSPVRIFRQELLGATRDSVPFSISYIATPAAGSSPAGLHVHEVDQVFYLLSGSMHVEVSGATYTARPGSLILFPRGAPHRNWNDGPEGTVHLAINAAAPDSERPFARRVSVCLVTRGSDPQQYRT